MERDDPPLTAERADPEDASSAYEFTRGETRSVRCATCGATIDPTVWHPVSTRIDDDGEFHLDVFCSIECRNDHERTRRDDE